MYCIVYDMAKIWFNTPRQNGHHFADDIFKLSFASKLWNFKQNIIAVCCYCPIYNIPSMVQIMAWRRSGNESLPTHICVTRPQWVEFKETAHTACKLSRPIFSNLFKLHVWWEYRTVPLPVKVISQQHPIVACVGKVIACHPVREKQSLFRAGYVLVVDFDPLMTFLTFARRHGDQCLCVMFGLGWPCGNISGHILCSWQYREYQAAKLHHAV